MKHNMLEMIQKLLIILPMCHQVVFFIAFQIMLQIYYEKH